MHQFNSSSLKQTSTKLCDFLCACVLEHSSSFIVILLTARLLVSYLQFTLPSNSGLSQSCVAPVSHLACSCPHCLGCAISTVSGCHRLSFVHTLTPHMDAHVLDLEWREHDVNRCRHYWLKRMSIL